MKARKENNQITPYNELPNSLQTDNGLITGFNYSDVATQEANGFFDLVTPEYDSFTQRLGLIQFDEVNRVFTYPVETLETPIPRPIPQMPLQQQIDDLTQLNNALLEVLAQKGLI